MWVGLHAALESDNFCSVKHTPCNLFSLSLSVSSLSHSHTHTHSLSLSLSHSLTHSLSLSLSLSHTRSHSLSLSLMQGGYKSDVGPETTATVHICGRDVTVKIVSLHQPHWFFLT